MRGVHMKHPLGPAPLMGWPGFLLLVVLAGWQGAHGRNLRWVEAVAGGFEREEAAREEAAHGASVLAVVDGEIVVRRAARAHCMAFRQTGIP